MSISTSSRAAFDTTPQLFFLDLEVSDVTKQKGDVLPCITEIALYAHGRNKAARSFKKRVAPPSELFPEKSVVGKDDKNPPQPFTIVWPELRKWVNSTLTGHQNAIIIAHNGYEHDWDILKTEVSRVMYINQEEPGIPKSWRIFDSLYLANAMHIPCDCKSLTSLCHALGVKVRQAHIAYNDVKMLRDVFYKMVGDADMESVLKAAMTPQHPIKAVAETIKSQISAMNVFFDFETTGLFPKKGEKGPNPRVVEVAGFIPEIFERTIAEKTAAKEKKRNRKLTEQEEAKIRKNAEDFATFSRLVNPECKIPEEATKVHTITDQDVAKAKTFKKVWTKFEEWMHEHRLRLGKIQITLSGHNIWNYDIPVYESECERTGLKKRRWKSMDTYFLSSSLFKGIKTKQGFHKLQTLRAIFGIPEDQAHRAAGDVRVNAKVFKVFTKGLTEKQISAAILSAHPVLSMKSVIMDHGQFKPMNHIQGSLAPVAPPAVKSVKPIVIKPVVKNKDRSKAGKEEMDFEETRKAHNKSPINIPSPVKKRAKRIVEDDEWDMECVVSRSGAGRRERYDEDTRI